MTGLALGSGSTSMFELEILRISMIIFVISTWDWGSEAAISFNQVVGHCSTTVEI